jgi:hypothetical protein
MATVTKPMALDESIKTTESTSRNIADVLAQELSGIASAITGGDDKANKTDIATVEPTNTASRAYSVGELVYVNGNLYKVITAIASGATFTFGTNIQSTNVNDVLDALNEATTSDGLHNVILEEDFSVSEYFNYFKIGRLVVVNIGGLLTANASIGITVTRDLPIQRSRPIGCLMNDTSNDIAVLYGNVNYTWLSMAVHSPNVKYYGQIVYLTD